MDSIRRNIDLLLFEQFLLEKFNPESFLDKARSVMELVRRGATQGERDAGKMGMQRLMLRAKEEIGRMREEGTSAREIERFMTMLQQISTADKPEPPRSSSSQQQRRPEPPKRAEARFKVGRWVVCRDTDGEPDRLGKVINVRPNRFDESYTYEVKMSDSLSKSPELFNEDRLRAATQEDLDAAASKRPSPAKFKGGEFVVHLDDGALGRVAKDGEGWDRSTNSRWYQVDFLDGGHDLIEEKFLRAATMEEVEAKLKPKSNDKAKTNSGERAGNDIQRFARYVNPAERSDKVYGVVKRKGKIHTFWGGHGKALATKQYADPAEAYRQYDSKINKGYKETPPMGQTHTWLDNALNDRFNKIGEAHRYRATMINAPRTDAPRRRI